MRRVERWNWRITLLNTLLILSIDMSDVNDHHHLESCDHTLRLEVYVE